MKRYLLPIMALWLSFPVFAATPDAADDKTGQTDITPGSLAEPPTPGSPAAEAAAANAGASSIPEGALEVTATGTLEWLRQDLMYVARQNAVARHNDTTLKGDVLVAHYTTVPGKKDSTQISQITADGDPVILASPSAVMYGQHGVYDLNKHEALLLGNNLKLVTTDEVVTSKDSMEYFEDISTGVARGDAVMVHDQDRLTADVIAAKFTDPKQSGDQPDSNAAGKSSAKPVNTAAASDTTDADGKKKGRQLERLDAKGHVVLTTPTDTVTGQQAVYNPLTNQATVIGDVRVTRDSNQLDGVRAEVDMDTGISRVFASPTTRVRALFIPKKRDADTGNTQAQADDSQ